MVNLVAVPRKYLPHVIVTREVARKQTALILIPRSTFAKLFCKILAFIAVPAFQRLKITNC